jgi:uncharacterized protein
MGWDRRAFLAAALATVPSLSLAEPSGPALWEVRHGKAKVFLFGDSGPLRAPWRSGRIEAALKESAVLWKEVPDNGGLFTALQALVAGVDLSEPLSAWLTPKERDRVAAAAAASGVAPYTIAFCKPWLAAQFLESGFYQRNGFKQDYSADNILPAIARTAGKPIRSEFPDMAAVIDYADGFSRSAAIQSLLFVVEQIEAGARAMERFDKSWAAGDEKLQVQEIEHWKRTSPDFYSEVLIARNRRWLPRIRDMLKGGGTTFVLVGGAHLPGPDGILKQLAAAGLTAQRA